MNTKETIRRFFPFKSEATITAYAADLDAFCAYLSKSSAEESLELLFSLPESQANLLVLHYKTELYSQGQKASSINRKLSTLRSLVSIAFQSGLTDWKLDIQNEKPDAAALVLLSGQQVKDLLTAALSQSNSVKAARDHAIICLLYDLGLKRHIIADLVLSNLDLGKKILTIPALVNRAARIKALPARTAKSLSNWLVHRGNQEGLLFRHVDASKPGSSGITSTSIYRIVKNLGQTLGLNITPELVRQSAISEALRQASSVGLSESDLLAFSDHKSVQSIKQIQKKQVHHQRTLSALLAKN